MTKVQNGVDYLANLPVRFIHTYSILASMIKSLCHVRDDDQANNVFKKDIEQLESLLDDCKEKLKAMDVIATDEEFEEYKNGKELTKEQTQQLLDSFSVYDREDLVSLYNRYTTCTIPTKFAERFSNELLKQKIPHAEMKSLNMVDSMFVFDQRYLEHLERIARQIGCDLKRENEGKSGMFTKEDFLNNIMKKNPQNVICLEGIPASELKFLKENASKLGIPIGYEVMADTMNDKHQKYNIYYNCENELKFNQALINTEYNMLCKFSNVLQLQAEYDMNVDEKIRSAIRLSEENNETIVIQSEVLQEHVVISPTSISAYSKDGVLVKALDRKETKPSEWLNFTLKYTAGMKSVMFMNAKKHAMYQKDEEFRKQVHENFNNSRLAFDTADPELVEAASESLKEFDFISDFITSKMQMSNIPDLPNAHPSFSMRNRGQDARRNMLANISSVFEARTNLVKLKAIDAQAKKVGKSGIDSQKMNKAQKEYDEQKEQLAEKYNMSTDEIKNFFNALEAIDNPDKMQKISENTKNINNRLDAIPAKNIRTLEMEIAKSEDIGEKAAQNLANEMRKDDER